MSFSSRQLKTLTLLTQSILQRDPYLALALVIGALLVFNGIWWGWSDCCWHPDQMALRGLGGFGSHFLEPGEFLKPPFHTYLNFFLSVLPVKLAERAASIVTGSAHDFTPIAVWWSRLIQLGIFLGVICLSYRIVRRFSSVAAARSVAIITATSAGIVLQAHFLTADIPVTFWMLASFYCAQSILYMGRTRDYVLAGLLAGVATATKYNGLAIGLAIPIFHLFATKSVPLYRTAFDRRLIAGVAVVVVGFVIANPYAVLDFPRFSADFIYNYVTTPVYGGNDPEATGYGTFLLAIPEILGWPMAVVTALGVGWGIFRLRQASIGERGTVLAALGVSALYFWKFGSAPRVEVRFVLPIVPLMLFAGASLWSTALHRQYRLAVAALAALIAYNIVASYWVGRRFIEDPRMAALHWVSANVRAGSAMESSTYTPSWKYYAGISVASIRMPTVSGRNRLFSRMFAGDEQMRRAAEQHNTDAGLDWYSAPALAARSPEFIAIDSLYFDRFLGGDGAADYPGVYSYFNDLLSGRLGYRIVYDRSSDEWPRWLYPGEIKVLENRMVILRRASGTG